jgi:hypothetical protein
MVLTVVRWMYKLKNHKHLGSSPAACSGPPFQNYGSLNGPEARSVFNCFDQPSLKQGRKEVTRPMARANSSSTPGHTTCLFTSHRTMTPASHNKIVSF